MPILYISSGSCRFEQGLNQIFKILITNNYVILKYNV